MRSDGWPPTRFLWVVAIAVGAVGAVVVVIRPQVPWGPLLLGGGLAVAAVAVSRAVRARGRGGGAHPRRLHTPETQEAAEVVGRRPLLTRGLAAAFALLGVGALGGLWRFGPRRSRATGWADGVRVVDAEGMPVRADALPPGSIVTGWPAGTAQRELGATVVLRLTPPRPDGGEDAGSLVAYSRICTHAGCPVALFRADEGVLYCPCHQATFDARRDARPVFGPASEPLPRLPIGVDGQGFLVARGDFDVPPGPPDGGGRP